MTQNIIREQKKVPRVEEFHLNTTREVEIRRNKEEFRSKTKKLSFPITLATIFVVGGAAGLYIGNKPQVKYGWDVTSYQNISKAVSTEKTDPAAAATMLRNIAEEAKERSAGESMVGHKTEAEMLLASYKGLTRMAEQDEKK